MNTYSWPFIIARRLRFRLYRLLRRRISSHNANWYGADPTGKMDSTQAIQNAIDTVGSVGFSGGRYITTETFFVIDDKGSLQGQGSEHSIIAKEE